MGGDGSGSLEEGGVGGWTIWGKKKRKVTP